MPRQSTALEKLLEQESKLQTAIRAAKRKAAAAAAEVEGERCRIIGAAVVAEMKAAPDFARTLETVIDRHTKAPKDRAALGLKGAEEKSRPAVAGQSKKPEQVSA
jgi:L-amino acid N-acyltransferase YncA